MDLTKAKKNNRLMKSLTGMSVDEFEILLPRFEQCLKEAGMKKDRQRAIGGGKKGVLSSPAHKLFFMLFYLKVYPVYDVAGFLFGGVDKSRPCRWVSDLLPILEKALGRTCRLPARKIESVEEFFRLFPSTKDLFVDGTERPAQRPKGKNQARRYSGKKNRHTRANLLGCNERKEILLLSPTRNGKAHDKKLWDKSSWEPAIPPDIALWLDKGFEGIHGPNVIRPKKKHKNKELTPEQKQENKIISGLRIINEHAIAGIKRLNSLSHVYRNRKGQDDKFILLASGIWNLHLQTS